MITRHIPVEPLGIVLSSWTDGTFVSVSDTFLLEKDEGAGWVTVPSTEYALHASIGEVVKRDYDASSGAAVEWADGASFRATYTLINTTTLAETTKTQEAQTADYLDEFVASDGEGELMASAPRDLIIQEIHAGKGYIGRWTINRQYLARDTGNDATSAGMAPIDYPFYAGATYANRANAKFWVNTAGDASIAGSVNVGGTLTVAGSVQSDDFSAGISGWRIRGATSDAEFQNIKARGRFEAAVFVKGMESAMAGTQIIAKSAGKLDADMVVPGSGTWVMTLDDPPDTGYLLDNNDICVVTETQGGTSKTWFTVQRLAQSGGQQTYTCTFQSGTRPNTFHKGNIVVDYGVSGQGILVISADRAAAPYYSVQTHAGSPWSAMTERGRFGNMNGAFGVASDYYGFGVGDYSGGNYLKYETNGGFQLRAGGNALGVDANGLTLVEPAADSTTVPSSVTWRATLGGTVLSGISDWYQTSITTRNLTIFSNFDYVGAGGGAAAGGKVILVSKASDGTTASLNVFAHTTGISSISLDANYIYYSGLEIVGTTTKTRFQANGGSPADILVLDLANARVGLGTDSPGTGYNLDSTESIRVNSSTNNSGFVARFTGSSSASVGPQNRFVTNDGSAMASADRIGAFLFNGYDGSAEVLGGAMIVAASQAWSTTARGTKITFYTTPNSTTSLTAALVLEQDGTATITNNANVGGEYRVDNTRVVTNRVTGWESPTGTATRTAFATGSVTTAQLAERVKALIDDLMTHGLIGA